MQKIPNLIFSNNITKDIDAHCIGRNGSIKHLKRKISFLYCVLNSAGMEKILQTGTLNS